MTLRPAESTTGSAPFLAAPEHISRRLSSRAPVASRERTSCLVALSAGREDPFGRIGGPR